MPNRVQVGQAAPDFDLPSTTGERVTLKQFHGKSEVVLFFYPKDNTSVCTAQACSFRDHHDQFVAAGATVIGISSDSIESHLKFALGHRLPYCLLSDRDNAVRNRYGVPWKLGFIPGRVTYLIDKQGIVRQITDALLQSSKHVHEALRMLAELRSNA